MRGQYDPSLLPAVFSERESLQNSAWCRHYVRKEIRNLGGNAASSLVVVEDRIRKSTPSHFPTKRWSVSSLQLGDTSVYDLIRFNPDDTSELPVIDYATTDLSVEDIELLQRVARRGGKIMQSAHVAEVLDNPPAIEIWNPLSLIHS